MGNSSRKYIPNHRENIDKRVRLIRSQGQWQADKGCACKRQGQTIKGKKAFKFYFSITQNS